MRPIGGGGSRLLNMHIPRGSGLIHLPLLPRPITKQNKGCVKLWPYNLHFKNYVKTKRRRIMEVAQIFHHAKKYNLQKRKSSKGNQNPSRYYYYNFYYNYLSQVSTQAKISSFEKSSDKNRPIIIIITY
jgi:hypothetical protein